MRETFTVAIPAITDQEKRVVEQAEEYMQQVSKKKGFSFLQAGVKKIWVEFEFDYEKKTKRVTGVVGLAILPDVRVFHMEDRKATVNLAGRILGYLADTTEWGDRGAVFVSKDMEKSWKAFLDGIKATKGYRWIFPIGPQRKV